MSVAADVVLTTGDGIGGCKDGRTRVKDGGDTGFDDGYRLRLVASCMATRSCFLSLSNWSMATNLPSTNTNTNAPLPSETLHYGSDSARGGGPSAGLTGGSELDRQLLSAERKVRLRVSSGSTAGKDQLMAWVESRSLLAWWWSERWRI